MDTFEGDEKREYWKKEKREPEESKNSHYQCIQQVSWLKFLPSMELVINQSIRGRRKKESKESRNSRCQCVQQASW